MSQASALIKINQLYQYNILIHIINLKVILVYIVHLIDFHDGSIFQGKGSSLSGALRRNAEALRQGGHQPGTLRDPHLDWARQQP